MTEPEWLACEDPVLMLDFIRERVSERKLRLWACTCHQQQNGRFKVISDAIKVAEDWAEGKSPIIPKHPSLTYVCSESAWHAAYQGTALELKRLLTFFPETAEYRHALRHQLLTLRDIFPFHPITLSPSWLTSTVVSLAQQMYDSRDFSAMPILADALQDCGCDNEEILNHCRGLGPHVRGCFVIDLLTGRE